MYWQPNALAISGRGRRGASSGRSLGQSEGRGGGGFYQDEEWTKAQVGQGNISATDKRREGGLKGDYDSGDKGGQNGRKAPDTNHININTRSNILPQSRSPPNTCSCCALKRSPKPPLLPDIRRCWAKLSVVLTGTAVATLLLLLDSSPWPMGVSVLTEPAAAVISISEACFPNETPAGMHG
jgi:hypothetical protein